MEDGETGVIVDEPADERAVAEALESLIDQPERLAEMGRAARLRAERVFDYDVLARDLDRALTRLATPARVQR